MKKNLFLFILSALILITGCKKYKDALPQVQFVSANPYGQDSLLITGNVTNSGGDAIQYVGFSYSEQPSFDLLSNQVLLNGTSGRFSVLIPAKQDSTYYFKCFAANSYGYAVSSVFKYTFPVAGPDSAPCSLATNYISDNYTGYPTPYVYGGAGVTGFGSYGIQASDVSGLEVLNISFNEVPANGVYTTTDYSTFSSTSNHFLVYASINGYALNSGGSIYVAIYKSGTTTVSFCTISYMAFSNNYPISAKLTY